MKMSIKKETERLPLNQAAELAENLRQILLDYFPVVFIGGSIVRKSETCGDIDIAVQLSNIQEMNLAGMERFREFGSVIMNGSKSSRLVYEYSSSGIGKFVQVDLWAFPRYNWGAGCMFVAGNGTLNIRQRYQARAKGYVLGFSLSKISTGEVIDLPTELDVYEFLGWPWIPYEKRSV